MARLDYPTTESNQTVENTGHRRENVSRTFPICAIGVSLSSTDWNIKELVQGVVRGHRVPSDWNLGIVENTRHRRDNVSRTFPICAIGASLRSTDLNIKEWYRVWFEATGSLGLEFGKEVELLGIGTGCG
jgi:hypothetical protein